MSTEQNSLSIALIQHEENSFNLLNSGGSSEVPASPTADHEDISPTCQSAISPSLVYTDNHRHRHHQCSSEDRNNSYEWENDVRRGYGMIQLSFKNLLQSQDHANRQNVLDSLSTDILQSVEENRSMVEESTAETNGIFRRVLSTLLRLSMRCPIVAIKEKFKNLLMEIKTHGITIPSVLNKSISSFIPNKEIPADDDSSEDQTYAMFAENFHENGGRLEHMIMVMGMHSQYLRHFLNTSNVLLQPKGSLTIAHRYFIAIMAAARHRCPYLVHLLETKFINCGGDEKWLQGIRHAPVKLQALSTLNKYLAHRPWLVTAEHIKSLCQGDRSTRWQVSDLVQAIVLMCHFHSLAGFCHSTGINLEIDHQRAHVYPDVIMLSPAADGHQCDPFKNPKSCCDEPKPKAREHVDALLKEMKRLSEKRSEEVTIEERHRHFEKEKSEASRDLLPPNPSGATKEVKSSCRGEEGDWTTHCSRYVEDPHYSFQEFKNCAPTFRALDYNWDDHACMLLTELYGEVAELLDEKFKVMRSLTYKTLAFESDVDTSSLRRAIWMYIHCMYGIMYDDYNYGEVHHLLETPLKQFIRTVSSVPEMTTKALYDNFWRDFRHSEKVHVSVILLESRLQVGLLYGMRALHHYHSRS